LQPPMRLREWPYWARWKRELLEMGHAGLPDDDEIITFELLKHFNDLSSGFAHGALAASPALGASPSGEPTVIPAGEAIVSPGQKKRAARRAAAKGSAAPSLRRRDMGRKGAARWTELMENTSAKAEFADEAPLSREAIGSIRVPTLAMFGELSHCLPSCRQLEKLIPRTHVAIVPGAGHFHPAVKPRRFVQLLNHFLREHPGASRARALPAGARSRAALAARTGRPGLR
ncbi:MAG: alpha/beta hydrolase, partial [Pseudomonadota bacterium]